MYQKLFTKQETGFLTGLTPRQLDYWASDKLGIVPKSLSGKKGQGQTVVYELKQLFYLMIAIVLKKQGFSNTFISEYLKLYGLRKDDVFATHVIKLKDYENFKQEIDNFDLEIFKSRLIQVNEDVHYVLISQNEIQSFIDLLATFNAEKLLEGLEKLNLPSALEIADLLYQNGSEKNLNPRIYEFLKNPNDDIDLLQEIDKCERLDENHQKLEV